MSVDDALVLADRKKYLRTLTKALLHFGAPTNRLDKYLYVVSRKLDLDAVFISLPGRVIVNIRDAAGLEDPRIVEADGHSALSTLEQVHDIAHAVHKGLPPREGTRRLHAILHAPPLYGRVWRCMFAFVCSGCFSLLEFGGSPIDMPLAGLFSAVLLFIKVKFTGHEEESVEVFEFVSWNKHPGWY
jgi:uncharacterized membrane protein YjjP (DUF1212 family)